MSNSLILPYDAGRVSDGYHTFDELYDHRHLLWINLLHCNKDQAFKTWLNQEGEYLGWFIAGMNTIHGELTYHLPMSYWQLLDVTEVERNRDFDGHSSEDVLERLRRSIHSEVSD